jgi:SAM-dependent methyltransferase
MDDPPSREAWRLSTLSRQKDVVQGVLFGFAASGADNVPTASVVDAALEWRPDLFGGKTPRNSVRRTLTQLQAEGLVIKDGRGHLRIRLDALTDCVVHGDVLELLRLCPDGSLPMVHADPPWSYMETHTSTGTTTRMVGAGTRWFETPDLPEEVIREVYRALKPGGVFFVWFPPFQEAAQEQWETLSTIHRVGFKDLREATWDKESKGGGYGLAPQTEPCFVFFKDHRPTFYDLTVTNLLRHPRLRAEDKTAYTDFTQEDERAWEAALTEHGSAAKIPPEIRATLKERCHACEKPVGLLMDLLRPFLGPGKHGRAPEGENLLVDLYAGSASASLAAVRLGAHFLAVEKDERNVEHLIAPRLSGWTRTILRVRGST